MATPRLFITTDMQMMTGVNNVAGDKDDVQSLVHALMYQDEINIVGIASSTSRHQPGANDADFIHRVIDAYAKDQPKLAAQSDGFKTADQLHDITYQGTKTLAGESGAPGATEASRAIIEAARAAEKAGDPLYVTTWGGMGDVARALRDAPDIADTVRLLSASGPKQEPNAYAYVKDKFAGEGDLWWIDAQSTQVGIYANPEGRTENLSNGWAVKNARDHGALGEMFYENTLDVKGKLDNFDAVKMGDSFGVFYLIDNPNGDPNDESWAGSYRKADNRYWVDRSDIKFDWAGSDGVPTTYEHRKAWQADLAERFDWLKGNTPDSGKGGSTDEPPRENPRPKPDGETPTGGSRPDDLTGGSGDDTYYVRKSGQVVEEAAGGGDDAVHAYVSWTLSANVEDMFLRGPKDNSATGNDLENLITGNSGNNEILGHGEDDRLEGRGGDDTIDGGWGDDLLIGGEGDDQFVLRRGSDDDVIRDFEAGEDRIVIKDYGPSDDYDIQQRGDDVLVTLGEETILLQDIKVGSLAPSDFLFA